jgi:hypothetical protein
MACHSVPNPNRRQQPIAGNLAARNFTDISERRLGLSASNLFFAIGNLICGLSTNKHTLIRVAILSTSDLTPLRKRGIMQGIAKHLMAQALCLGLQRRLTPRPHRLRLAAYVLRPNTPLVAIDPGHLHSYGGSL